MASRKPYTLRWGIMATGWIAEVFCKDLLTNPASRDVDDVGHQIVAVSSSSSVDKASSFIEKIDGPRSAKLYDSYAELVADPNVDIVYVATPRSHHFQNAMLALQAGKNVLCEKALTVTAAQAKKLVETAKSKGLFFMEAVWTRYFPLSIQVRHLIASGEIGTVYRTFADLSFNENSDEADGIVNFADSHRMVNKDLAGGALLDLGIYALTWVFQTLYHLQPEEEKEAPKVLAAMNHYRTGADETTALICQFPAHRSMGLATTSLLVGTAPRGNGNDDADGAPAVRIQGSKGEIQVLHPAYRPTRYRIVKKKSSERADLIDCPVPQDPERNWGHGMFWEADECARCIRDGKLESDTLPWAESIAIMETMESALQQGGVGYPDLITTDEYDANSPLNMGNQ